MPEQRRWTLVRTSRGRFETHGPEVKPGESVPAVEAVLSPELVEKVARAIDDEARGGLDGIRDEREDGLEGFAREALRAAGFVSEPSTGGE